MTPLATEKASTAFYLAIAALKATAPDRLRKGVIDDLCADDPSTPREVWERLYDAKYPADGAAA